MAVDWQPLALAPRARFDKQFGAFAELVRRRAPDEPSLAPTWLLEKKALRRALSLAVPPGHLPVDIAAETNALLFRQKAARAYSRLRDVKQLVPASPKLLADPAGGRLLVWSSPAPKPRRLELPQLCRVLEVDGEQLADAVAELWSGIFFESVLCAVERRAARIEVGIGVTRASDEARLAFVELLSKAHGAEQQLLPLPGQPFSRLPLVELDRSLAERRMRAVSVGMGSVTKVPRRLFAWSGGQWGVDREVLGVLEGTKVSHAQRDALVDLLGAADAGVPTAGPELRRLGSWVETLLEDRATERQLEREIDEEERELAARFSWMREMDLAILPADGLRRTIEELLVPIDRVTALAFRAAHAAAFVGRLYGALGSFEAASIDAGLELAPHAFLRELAWARQRIDEGEPSGVVAYELWMEHPEYFPGDLARDPFRALDTVSPEVLESLELEPRFDVDDLREKARVASDHAIARAEARAPRFVLALTAPLRSRARRMVELRERARAMEVRLDYLLRRVLFDAGRRLPRFELDLDESAVWHVRVSELIDAVDLRGHSLRDRVRFRRAEFARLVASARALGAAGPGPAPVALAAARQLDALAKVVVGAPAEVRYEGRPSDTAPTVLRALGFSVICSVHPT